MVIEKNSARNRMSPANSLLLSAVLLISLSVCSGCSKQTGLPTQPTIVTAGTMVATVSSEPTLPTGTSTLATGTTTASTTPADIKCKNQCSDSLQILPILSFAISLLSFYYSFLAYQHSRSSIVRDFFKEGDSEEMVEYRKIIYEISESKSEEEKLIGLKTHSKAVSHVLSFYNTWALLLKKHYLPRWTFQASTRDAAIEIYEITQPYIEFRRGSHGEYAKHFEWLKKDLESKQKKTTKKQDDQDKND